MTFKTFYNLRSLIKAGDRIAETCTTISFDIFDTLLIRRVHDPDLVKRPVAQYISTLAQSKDMDWSWQKVQKLRDSIEQKQRIRTGKIFADHEACYSDFMRETLTTIFGTQANDALLDQVTDFELASENTMLIPRAELVDWLIRLKNRGIRIILLSDIYLPATHLRKIISYAGFLEHITDVISSADTFLAKASGNAFHFVKDRHQVSLNSWLHVGDNPISDGLRPTQIGIQSLVIKDIRERIRKAIIKRHILYGKHRPYWKGRALQQTMMPLEGENIKQHPLYVEGYNFFAPLIGAFIQRIAERCCDLSIEHIFFLSREGWLFEKFWQAATPYMYPGRGLPQESYLYVSRIALAGATCAYQGLTRTNAQIAFLPPGNRDFHDLCRVFSLDITPLIAHLAKHGLSPDDPLSSAYPDYRVAIQNRFHELLKNNAFQSEVRRQTKPYNDALQCYLEAQHFFQKTEVALVDIGWLGTIQRFLYEAIKHRQDKPRIQGFLFAASRGIPYPSQCGNDIEGVLYDHDKFDFAASSIMYTKDLFEEACRAPHPTLNGYQIKNNDYKLLFRTQDDAIGKEECSQSAYFSPLQDGILSAAPRYGAAQALLGYSYKEIKPWLNHIFISKLSFPKIAEIKIIKHKAHLDDFSGPHKSPSIQLKKHLWDRSLLALRFNPLLKLKYYFSNIRAKLKE